MKLPTRKSNRLLEFDYSSNHAYFITICAKDKKCLFGHIATSAKHKNVGATNGRPPEIMLSKQGLIVDEAIKTISQKYCNVIVDKYIIMPNHIHLLLTIKNGGRAMLAPTISTVIQQMKGYVSKTVGEGIWQKSFYDHIIRDEDDYLEIWQYIDSNAQKWEADKLYIKD